MEFNLEQIDTLLSTTRAVRRRLDFNREVPDEVLLRCIDLAEQAPSGGNVASRRWLVIRDADTKARLAALYRDAGGRGLIETAERLRGCGQARAGGDLRSVSGPAPRTGPRPRAGDHLGHA